MARRTEDSTAWVGYSDFLTTLTVLFFIFAAMFAGKLHSGRRAGWVVGTVTGLQSPSTQSCLATLGVDRQQRTDPQAGFAFRVDSLRDEINAGLQVTCHGYRAFARIITIRPGDTTRVEVPLVAETSISIETLPGDALFPSNQAVLKPDAIGTIVTLGKQLQQDLGPDEVIAVEGHTDDKPFPVGSEGDNWTLSGDRAAAAAKILTDPAYGIGIPGCHVVIMGFGPSRPIAPVLPDDPHDSVLAKRARNRRIEFRKMRGSELSGGSCGR